MSQSGPAESSHARSPRMEAFQREVAELRIRGGAAGPEGRLLVFGVLLLVAGLVVVVIGWYGASGTKILSEQIPYLISGGLLGIGLTVIGAALYVRFSLARYLRFWLIRLIYEQREQTDRTVAALERIEARLGGEGAAEQS